MKLQNLNFDTLQNKIYSHALKKREQKFCMHYFASNFKMQC